MPQVNARNRGRRGQKIVGQSGRLRLTVGIEHHVLEQRITEAVRNAAEDLPFDDHWVYHSAAVMNNDVARDAHFASLRIDIDLGNMGSVAVC